MTRLLLALCALCCLNVTAQAQDVNNQVFSDGTFTAEGYEENRQRGSDSIQSQHKEIPRGLKVWTVDELFGDRTPAVPDTLSYMYMNSIFTTGLYGEYNTLGNLGSPRQSRIFTDRMPTSDFFFMDAYDYFLVRPSDFQFTSTLSPITVLSYNTAGDRVNGEDHFKALFAVNAGKRWGFGFKFDYLYGRGYYDNQSTSHFNYSMWGSYLGERYQAHLLLSTNHQKVTENGGIGNDAYITHPEMFNESFATDEIPTVLQHNWNRYDNQHAFFNHRYSVGFYRQVPMTAEEIEARKFAIRSQQENAAAEAKAKARRKAERNGEEFDEEEYDRLHNNSGKAQSTRRTRIAHSKSEQASDTTRIKVNLQDADQMAALLQEDKAEGDTTQWMKREYVPVTSFIHSVKFDNWRRIYQAYETPDGYYGNDFYTPTTFTGDSVYDKSKSWTLKNTFAVALLEGFNKWAKAGLKAFVSIDLRHFSMPSVTPTTTLPVFNGMSGWAEHSVSVGGQLLKTQGKKLNYNVSAEAWLEGDYSGQLNIDGNAAYCFRLMGDTARITANAFLHRTKPSALFRTYHARHFWWDNQDLDQSIHSRIMAGLAIHQTGTTLRVGYDVLKNYTYLGVQNTRELDGDNYLTRGLTVNVRQADETIGLFTAQLEQNLRMGILHWNNRLTYQKSGNQFALAVPSFNVYSNLFIRFKIARVLQCDFGGDLRWFTKYYASEYIPGLSTFGVQETETSRTEVGGYPLVNVYANFLLKHTRFFVMMSHVNCSSGGDYFFTPHYPLNGRIFRFGLSWNFFN